MKKKILMLILPLLSIIPFMLKATTALGLTFILIAASNAPDFIKAEATVVVEGYADDEINGALSSITYGQPVHLSVGFFPIQSDILWPGYSGTTLSGDGRKYYGNNPGGTTIRLADGVTDKSIIKFPSNIIVKHAVVKNMHLDGNSKNTFGTSHGMEILGQISDSKFEDLSIFNCRNDAVHADIPDTQRMWEAYFNRIMIEDNRGNGMSIKGKTLMVWLNECSIWGTGGYGLIAERLTGWQDGRSLQVDHSDIFQNGLGSVRLIDVDRATFSDSMFGSLRGTPGLHDIIYMKDCQDIIFNGNLIADYNASPRARYGVNIADASCDNVILTDNIFRGFLVSPYNVAENANPNGLISSNTIEGWGSDTGFQELLTERIFEIPTNAGWFTSTKGSGKVEQYPTYLQCSTGITPNSQALAYLTCYGFGEAGRVYYEIDYSHPMIMSFDIGRMNWDADAIVRFQAKETCKEGALTSRGLGIRVDNLSLVGESYGSELGEVELGNLTINKKHHIIIRLYPRQKIEWYVDGKLVGVQTDTSLIPQGHSAINPKLVSSIINGSNSDVNSRWIIMGLKIWQRR